MYMKQLILAMILLGFGTAHAGGWQTIGDVEHLGDFGKTVRSLSKVSNLLRGTPYHGQHSEHFNTATQITRCSLPDAGRTKYYTHFASPLENIIMDEKITIHSFLDIFEQKLERMIKHIKKNRHENKEHARRLLKDAKSLRKTLHAAKEQGTNGH